MKTAKYSITFGLSGCYLPDNHSGVYEFTRRKDLAVHIRWELENYGLPASLFKQVRITRLWSFIKKNGASVAHFNLYHKQFVLAFNGLTDEEYEQGLKEMED